MSQYALVPKAEPVVVVIRDDEPLNADSVNDGRSSVTSQLLNLYESYAETYPNPALQEENHERDRLLRAISAANHAVQVNPKKEPNKSSWWNLFGGRTNAAKKNKTTRSTVEDDNDDDRLLYTDVIDEAHEYDSDYLLGTGFSLDETCIPDEVHSLARRYLCLNRKMDSARMMQQSSPKVARTTWETAGTSCIVITGLGQMVEFRKRTTNPNDNTTEPNRSNTNDHNYTSSGNEVYTSDRKQLLEYYEMRQQSSGRKTFTMTPWNPSQADAAMVGPNFLVVHWGLDSTVIFYRRVALPSHTVIADDSHYIVTWEAVAVSGATSVVRESLADLFSEDDDDNGETELIRVTAVHPLVVEIPQHAPIVTLVVARLGGFIELIPLPPQMWYGAELPFTKKHQQSHVTKRGSKRKIGDLKNGLSTIGPNLPDLAMNVIGGGGVVVLNTSDYHSDVYGLESFAIPGNINDVWNQESYPDGPPAQFVIAAYGTKAHLGQQAISFWSYSTHVSPSAPGGVGFSIHSTIVEAIELGKAGPDVTFFASPTIFRHWRKPRRVEVRDSIAGTGSEKSQRITTLSISVPIVQVSFVLLDGNDNKNVSDISVCAAVLDWNGGVTLLDCSLLIRTAAQTLNDDEYRNLFGNASQNELTSLVHVIANRTRIARSILKTNGSDSSAISYIKCFQMPTNDKNEIMVVAMSSDRLYFICATYKNTDDNSLSFKTTTVACPTFGFGQFLVSSKRQFILNLIFQATHCTRTIPSDRTVILQFCAVQKVKPYDIIDSLVRSAKFREAIIAAENLPSIEKASVESVLEQCKKSVWEAEFDFTVLDSIQDDEYIVAMARRPPFTSDDAPWNEIFLQDRVDHYKSVCQLALKRIRSARSWTALSFADDKIDIESRLVKLGTYVLLCGYQLANPSLRQFLNHFTQTPLLNFALYCAMNADIATLSLLWFRHRNELHTDHFKLLDALPVSVSPILYQHMLPVIHIGEIDKNSQLLFIKGLGFNDRCSVLEMPDYVDHHFERLILSDEEDESIIWERYTRIASSVEQYTPSTLADWYLHRANEIVNFAGSLASVTLFAQLGINALRIQNFDPISENDNSPSAVSLQQMVLFSELLSTQPTDYQYYANIGLKSFDSITTSDIVALTFSCVGLEPHDYQVRYNNYLLPLVKSKMTGCREQEISVFVDNAIENFCINLLECYESHNPVDFIGRVTTCSSIVHLSRASNCISIRIVKSIVMVMRLAIKIVEMTVKNSSLMQLTQKDEQCIVDRLWKIYESLPLLPPSSSGSNEDITTTMEYIYRSLTFLDIVTRWPNSDAFVILLRYQKVQGTNEFFSEGEEAIADICRLFCCQVESSRTDIMISQRAPNLLSALMNDCNELNTNCFEGKLQMKGLFIKYIARPLVKQNNAGLLGEYLSKADHNLVELKLVANDVLLSFYDTFHGASIGTRHETNMRAAMEFQDVVGKWLPAARDELQLLQQCLDAANFIANTLLPQLPEILRLEQIQSMRALDVVEYVLQRNAKTVVQNCSDWENPAWAKQANEMIRNRRSFDRENDEVSHIQPTSSNLPGESIFRLAQLLGLTDITSIIAVKSRVIDFTLSLNLTGAAAAVCRSLIIDSAATNVGIKVALAAVAKTVSRQEFDDASTKEELCTAAQHLFSASMEVQYLDPYDMISASWNQSHHNNVLWHHDIGYKLQSFGLFYSDATYISRVEIVEYAVSLNFQLANGLMNDTTIAALARNASLWCIDQATKARVNPLSSLESQAIDVVAAFAAALFLHLRDRQFSLDTLKQVKTTLDEQRDNASILVKSAVWIDPNIDIVKKLIGRGYSENGARRAALAVNNHSFHEALQWAVVNSQDVGFDDPHTILQSAEKLNICIEKAEFMKQIFDRLMTLIDDERIDLELRNDQIFDPPSIADNVSDKVSSEKSLEMAHDHEVNVKSETIASAFGISGSLETNLHRNDSGIGAPNGISHDDGNRSRASSLPIAAKVATPSTEYPAGNIEQKTALKINRAVILTSNPTGRSSQNLEPVVVSSREKPSITVTIPKSSETSPDRSTLYQVGQEAFVIAQQRRRPSSNPSRAERLRLIEEGRRLLKLAKSGVSSGSEQSGYLLRSAPTTPSTRFFGKEADTQVELPASIVSSKAHMVPITIPEAKETSEKPSGNVNDDVNESSKGADEWGFDDENFDL